jgi:hypothetical protein
LRQKNNPWFAVDQIVFSLPLSVIVVVSLVTRKEAVRHLKYIVIAKLNICKDFYLTYPYFLRSVTAKLQQFEIEPDTILRSVTAKSSDEEIGIVTTKSNEENNDLQLQPELLLSRRHFRILLS